MTTQQCRLTDGVPGSGCNRQVCIARPILGCVFAATANKPDPLITRVRHRTRLSTTPTPPPLTPCTWSLVPVSWSSLCILLLPSPPSSPEVTAKMTTAVATPTTTAHPPLPSQPQPQSAHPTLFFFSESLAEPSIGSWHSWQRRHQMHDCECNAHTHMYTQTHQNIYRNSFSAPLPLSTPTIPLPMSCKAPANNPSVGWPSVSVPKCQILQWSSCGQTRMAQSHCPRDRPLRTSSPP
jgi:hypothetical protein